MTNVHKVFVSYHHEIDQFHKDEFVSMMRGNIVDNSVDDGDIGDGLNTEYIRQKIRDEFIADATVCVVLVGPCTWQRKHVDWEIGSSISDTKKNRRCGLLGILLPNHPNYQQPTFNPRLIPPRLADNLTNNYAGLMRWTDNVDSVHAAIHRAFSRRNQEPSPNNSRLFFGQNRSGSSTVGWQD